PREIEVKDPKQGLEGWAGETVIAARNVGTQIAGLLQHDCSRQSQHQQRESAIAQQEPSGNKADESCRNRRSKQSAYRLRPLQTRGGKPDRVGTDTEEGSMPKRQDPGITKYEVERERKHHHNQHLTAEGHALRENEEDGDCDQPRQRLRRAKTMTSDQICS